MPKHPPRSYKSSELDLDIFIEECKKYPIGTPRSTKSVTSICQELEKKKSKCFSLITKDYGNSKFFNINNIFNNVWSEMIVEFTTYRIYIYKTNLTSPFFRDGWRKFYLAITHDSSLLTQEKLDDYCNQFEQEIKNFQEKIIEEIEEKIEKEQNQNLQENLTENKKQANQALDYLIEKIRNLSLENLKSKTRSPQHLWAIWLDFCQKFPVYQPNLKHSFLNWFIYYLKKRFPGYLPKNKILSLDTSFQNNNEETNSTYEVEDKKNKNDYAEYNIISCLEEDPYHVFSFLLFNNQPNINFQKIGIEYITYKKEIGTLGVWDEIIKTIKERHNIDIKKGAISAWWTNNIKFFTPLIQELIGNDQQIFQKEIILEIENDQTNEKYKKATFIKTITSGRGKDCYEQIRTQSELIKLLKSQKFDFYFHQLFLIKQKVGFDIGLQSKIIEELGLKNMSAEHLEIVIRNTIYFYLDKIDKFKIPLKKPYKPLKQKKKEGKC